MTWLIGLFAAPADAEAIAGDLYEERLAVAAREGQAAASQWYWRQVVRTVAQLAVSPLRQSPLVFAALGCLGLGVALPITWLTMWVAGLIVTRVPVYHYVPATAFWKATYVLPYLAVGFLSAMVMGRRAMCTAVAVVLAMAVWVTAINPMVLAVVLPPERMPPAMDYLTRALAALSIFGTSVLVGAALGILMRRGGMPQPPRKAHSV